MHFSSKYSNVTVATFRAEFGIPLLQVEDSLLDLIALFKAFLLAYGKVVADWLAMRVENLARFLVVLALLQGEELMYVL